jgi:hypothetical protein
MKTASLGKEEVHAWISSQQSIVSDTGQYVVPTWESETNINGGVDDVIFVLEGS